MLLWASSFVALKYSFESFDPYFVIFARMAVALLFVLLAFPRLLFRTLPPSRDRKYLLLMALFEPGLYFLFEAQALENTTASQAGMITALFPVMVAVGAWIWINERITVRILSGGALAVAGAIGLSLAAPGSAAAPHPLYGNFMEFLAMLSAVGYTLTLKELSHRYGALYLTAVQALVGSLLFGVLLLFRTDALPHTFDPAPLLAILYLGIAVTFAAYGLFNYGVGRTSASSASVYVNLIPIFAVLLGWLLLGERLGWQELLGAAVILAGVALAQSSVPPEIREDLADPETPKGA